MKKKVAILTGAASGIGAATAKLFAREGASVVLSDVQDESGKQVTEEIIEAGGTAVFFRADVSVPQEVESLVDFAVKKYGRLDVAVNNAGIGGEANLIAEMSLEGWQEVLNVNLNSIFYGMKFQIREMLRNGGGSIINISSILGQVGFPGSAAYVASKHAAIGLTKAAAVEYSSRKIRVNAVGPAFIETPLLNQINDDIKQQLVGMHPIGRLGRSEEVAELILWLGSDKSSFVCGSYYPVDGGYLSK